MKEPLPSMHSQDKKLLTTIPVNGTYILGIYQGSLSAYDILIKYRQLENGNMFKELLHKLKNHKNIFEIVSTASHTRTR